MLESDLDIGCVVRLSVRHRPVHVKSNAHKIT